MYKHTFFISYSRKDIDFANQLAQDLEKAGFDTWWDISGLKGGDTWVRTIQAALKASKYFVVVLSPDAVESEWVEKEYTYAIGLELTIIPILYKNCEVPMALANIQYIDFRGKKYDRGLQELFEILRVLAPDEEGIRLKPAMRRAPAKPRRPVNWERAGAIAGVIGLLIALGTWLVPNAADFLSTWLSETSAATPTKTPTTIAAVTPKPPTHTPIIYTATPTNTPFSPTATLTFTPAPPTPTPVPPTDTPAPIPPTPTPVLPTDTPTPSAPPPDMVYVPAGEFTMGSDEGDSDEQPVHTVYLDAFYIDRYEVTNAQFAQFLNEQGNQEEGGVTWLDIEDEDCLIIQREGRYQPISGYEDHPVIEVSWYGARAYCRWAGKRLPTEAEWEKACRGINGLIYPWGNTFDGTKLNFADKNTSFDWSDSNWDDGYASTAPVGSYPDGASPYGALDMAGNVWEWVADWHDSDYYSLTLSRSLAQVAGRR